MQNSSSSKMYKVRIMRGSPHPRLISSWRLRPVLVAVFICISISKCVSGEDSPSPAVPSSVISQSASAKVDTALQNPPQLKTSRCTQPKDVNGMKEISCSFYTIIPTDIEGADKIKVLDMSSDNTLQTVKNGNLQSSNLPELRKLILQNCKIHSIERGAFSGSGVLELDLSNNLIEVLDPEVFAGLIRLQTLKLQENPINRFALDAVFPPLQNLVNLDLSFCQIRSVPANVMSKLEHLKILNLQKNQLQRLDWRALQDNRVLQSLNLAENPWNCDCNIKFLMDFLDKHHSSLSPNYKQQAKCQSNDTWIDATEMQCAPKIENFDYTVRRRSAEGEIEVDKSKVQLDDNVYFVCEYEGHPQPSITWVKDRKRLILRMSNDSRNEREVSSKTISNSAESSTSIPKKHRILTNDDSYEITRSMNDHDKEYNYKYRERLMVYKVKSEDAGDYSCRIENGGPAVLKTTSLKFSDDFLIGGIAPVGGTDNKGLAVWMWILIVLICVLILILISLLTCSMWRRREKKKQEGFRKVVHEKFKDSNIDLGEFDIKTANPQSQQSKGVIRADGATPLLDNRSESSTLPMTDNQHRQNVPPLPDVALGNASLVRNSQIFSPKPPPSLHGYPGDARKEFFARQISEPYLRPASAMSMTRTDALNASQRRYIFANQPYQSEPIHGEQENQYAVPSHIRELPRSGSAMSVSALPEYDLRRLMFLKQYSQPHSQYGTTSRLPPRRIPSTSSEPPTQSMRAAFNYSTLPRRPIGSRSWSRPVSPTNSTCSTYSTLSWRPNIDPRTGVISDGMGSRNTALGGSSTSVNKIPDMNGTIIGEGNNGIDSLNRAMLTPSSAGKIKNTRTPRYGHNRTPSSLTRGHNDFFSFEPIQEVESSECASTLHLDRTGGRQTPTGYTTQSLARGDHRYKRKKPPPINLIPANLKTPSGAFEHLKGRSISPALRNNVANAEQPTEEIQSTSATAGDNDSNAGVPKPPKSNIVNNDSVIPAPMLESPIDEEAQLQIPTLSNSSTKAPPPPPPPKPRRQNPEEEGIHAVEKDIDDEPTKDVATQPAASDGTVV